MNAEKQTKASAITALSEVFKQVGKIVDKLFDQRYDYSQFKNMFDENKLGLDVCKIRAKMTYISVYDYQAKIIDAQIGMMHDFADKIQDLYKLLITDEEADEIERERKALLLMIERMLAK